MSDAVDYDYAPDDDLQPPGGWVYGGTYGKYSCDVMSILYMTSLFAGSLVHKLIAEDHRLQYY